MKNNLFINVLTSAASIYLIIVFIPLLWMLLTSLKDAKEILIYPPSLIPEKITIANYINLFRDTSFLTYLRNSFLVAACVVILTSTIATLGAYSLCRFDYFGKQSIVISSLLGYMIAPIMIVIPFYMMMRWFGIGDTRVALILAHTAFCFPFALWLMKSYIKDIPVELERAAKVDGANQLQTLVYVVLPMAVPGLTAVSIFSFILSWNDYVFARILITSDKLKTIPVGIEDIYNSTVVDWGMLMAAGVVVTIPLLTGFVLVNKVFMHGWGYTGLKS